MSRPKDSRVRAPSFVDGANRGGHSAAAQSGLIRVTSKSVLYVYRPFYVCVRIFVVRYPKLCEVPGRQLDSRQRERQGGGG